MLPLSFSSKIYVKVPLRAPDLAFTGLEALCIRRHPSGHVLSSLAPYSSRDMPGKHNKTDESVTDFTKVL